MVTDCLSFLLFAAAVLFYYLYKRTAEYMGDPRLYEDSLWLRDAFARARQWQRGLFLWGTPKDLQGKGSPNTTLAISSYKGQLKALYFKHRADVEPWWNSLTGNKKDKAKSQSQFVFTGSSWRSELPVKWFTLAGKPTMTLESIVLIRIGSVNLCGLL